ncbi:MAG: TetR/AcrR family transcriptional regulator, partial [Deltaproteobacteria bacterium]|nr:TetR/AcrR family transcriptional regulator [Deltaproteobacteria bacterium]
MRKNAATAKKDKEALIFRAALKTIKEKGYHKARMSDIAREAGISYGLVYHYFNNKEDLFDAILNRWWDGLFRLLADVNEGDYDVYQKLRHIIDYFLETYQSEPEMVNIFITEISRSTTNLTSSRLDCFKKSMSLTEAVIAEGQKRKVLRTDIKARYLTYMFLGAVETFLSTMVLVDQKIKGNAQKERITKSILEVFLNGAKKQKNNKKAEVRDQRSAI